MGKVFRFEAEAFEEWDIKADSLEEAEQLAEEHWQERFRGMFGGFDYKGEVNSKGEAD